MVNYISFVIILIYHVYLLILFRNLFNLIFQNLDLEKLIDLQIQIIQIRVITNIFNHPMFRYYHRVVNLLDNHIVLNLI